MKKTKWPKLTWPETARIGMVAYNATDSLNVGAWSSDVQEDLVRLRQAILNEIHKRSWEPQNFTFRTYRR